MTCRNVSSFKLPAGSPVWSRDRYDSFIPDIIFAPNTISEIQEIIRCAEEQQPPRKVRAIGSRYSLNTNYWENDYVLLPTLDGPLFVATASGSFPDDIPVPLRADAFPNAYGYAHAESGMSFTRLYQIIKTPLQNDPTAPLAPAALPTVGGGSSGGRLAGATSTGTHGSDVQSPPLQDYIRALHLIGSGGRQYWIERSPPNNITEPSGWSASPLNTEDFEPVYDDDLFFAAIVSLGRFGVIYSIVYEIVAPYKLYEERTEEPWPDVRATIRGKQAEELFEEYRLDSKALRLFQLDFSLGDQNTCYMTRRVETDLSSVLAKLPPTLRGLQLLGHPQATPVGPLNYEVPTARFLEGTWLAGRAYPPKDESFSLGDIIGDVLFHEQNTKVITDAGFGSDLEFIDKMHRMQNGDLVAPKEVADYLNDAPVAARRAFINFIVKEMMEQHPWGFAAGPSHAMDGGASDPGFPLPPGDSVDFAFDADSDVYVDVVDEILRLANPLGIAGWISVRYSKGTNALLGMQQFENTVSIEVSILKGIDENEEFLQDVKEYAVAHGGIPHWGQQHAPASPRETRTYYAHKLNTWRRALGRLSRQGRPNTFENQFCKDAGLTDPRRDNLLLFAA